MTHMTHYASCEKKTVFRHDRAPLVLPVVGTVMGLAVGECGELFFTTRQFVWSVNESVCTLIQDVRIKGHLLILPIFP